MKVDDAIKKRRTVKVLGDANKPLPVENTQLNLNSLLELAGQAPFHYACHNIHRENEGLTSIVPWRMHILHQEQCRILLEKLQAKGIDSGKIGRMLAVAQSLIIVNWLPDPTDAEDQLFSPTLRNMEHIAATSAAIQNLLLAATSLNMKNYWSSGGVLRSKEVFDFLQIPTAQILLGAIFLFHPVNSTAEEVEGKLRNLRGDINSWSRAVKF